MPDSVRVTVDCAGFCVTVLIVQDCHAVCENKAGCTDFTWHSPAAEVFTSTLTFDLFSLSSSFSGLPQLLLLVLIVHKQGVQLRVFLRRATLQASSREFVGAVFPLPVLVQCGNIAIQLPSESMPQV